MYTHPYSDPRYPEEPPKSSQQETPSGKKFSYILSISKKHIVFFILMMFVISSLIFISGITAGYSIGKNEGPRTEGETLVENTALNNYNNFDPSVLSANTSNSFEDSGTFVSEQVTLGSDFQDGDVLKVGPGNSSVPIQSLSSLKKKEKKERVQESPPTVSPSPNPAKANRVDRADRADRSDRNKKNKPKPSKTKNINKKINRKPTYIDNPQSGVTYYYIQVIATLSVDRAKSVYDQLKEREYPVKVKKSEKDGLYLYAIRVGLYLDKKLAQKHLRLIRRGGGYTQAFMKSYRIEPLANPTVPVQAQAQAQKTRASIYPETKPSSPSLNNPNSNELGHFKALSEKGYEEEIKIFQQHRLDDPQVTPVTAPVASQ